MCLAIPMKVVELHDGSAHCEARGVRREVSLFLLPAGSVRVGDFVMVHVGYAIQKVETMHANAAIELHEDIRLLESDGHA